MPVKSKASMQSQSQFPKVSTRLGLFGYSLGSASITKIIGSALKILCIIHVTCNIRIVIRVYAQDAGNFHKDLKVGGGGGGGANSKIN